MKAWGEVGDYQHSGTTYCFCFHNAMEVKATGSSETSVPTFQTTQSHNSEDHNLSHTFPNTQLFERNPHTALMLIFVDSFLISQGYTK